MAGSALAVQAPTSNMLSTDGKGTSMGDGAVEPRVGGDTIADAVPIPPGNLPFDDTGATCGYADDYDEVCPYTGSTSPDVVYSITPTEDMAIDVDLCASLYDTKTYIYAGGVGNLIACNDDAGCGYSGWQSLLTNVPLSAGVTYYIVVDGYGGACGSYVLQVRGYEPCVVECPPGSMMENEPPCVDNYADHWNGGCNSSPWIFEPMPGGEDGCQNMCGKSCTYLYQGLSYRDTDWFDCIGNGMTVNADVTAEFAVQFIFIWNADCNNLQYDLLTGAACQQVTLSHYMAAGVHFWLWVGAQVFTGVPESDYLLHACGMVPSVIPVNETSWGAIKSTYK